MTTEIIQQSQANNINKEIDTFGIIIYGKQGHGKTLCGIACCLDYRERIYSNFAIYYNGQQINRQIKTIDDIKKIRFSHMPGIVCIDEAGINANSKDTMSKDSRVLQEHLFLIRKYNCGWIWISQRFTSIDINARELSDLIIKMQKIRRPEHPIFKATIEKQKGSKLEFVRSYELNTIGLFKYMRISYNTLEVSKLGKSKSIEKVEIFD